MSFNVSSPYLNDGRLEDVIALIQVLGFDEETHRIESALHTELQRDPKSISTKKWLDLARQHEEFFRIYQDQKELAKPEKVSLLARHFHKAEEQKAPRLSREDVLTLVQAAVAIYSAQIHRQHIRITALTIGSVL